MGRLRYLNNGVAAVRPGRPNLALGRRISAPQHFTAFYEDQFAANNGHWNVYDNSNFGQQENNQRIGWWMASNVQFGAAFPGATQGTCCRLSTRRDVGGHPFSGGMMDTKGAGFWCPLYCYVEQREINPHGHGLWVAPAWMTAKIGGADMVEWDAREYFHSQLPGKMSSTLHSSIGPGPNGELTNPIYNRFTNNQNRTFFEAPTYTPQWHIWATEIVPVTDAIGDTLGDPTKPSQYVRYRTFLDGVEQYRFVDQNALYYTTYGGTIDSFWNIYQQGSQVAGKYNGHPDHELAYSDQLNQCLISGNPGACVTTRGGYSVIRAGAPGAMATLGTDATTLTLDYFFCAKYTG